MSGYRTKFHKRHIYQKPQEMLFNSSGTYNLVPPGNLERSKRSESRLLLKNSLRRTHFYSCNILLKTWILILKKKSKSHSKRNSTDKLRNGPVVRKKLEFLNGDTWRTESDLAVNKCQNTANQMQTTRYENNNFILLRNFEMRYPFHCLLDAIKCFSIWILKRQGLIHASVKICIFCKMTAVIL